MHLVIIGDPVDGCVFYGPFDTADAAVEWAEREVPATQSWWTTDLKYPEEEE